MKDPMRLTRECQALVDVARSRPTYVLSVGPKLVERAERGSHRRAAALGLYAMGLAYRQTQSLGNAVDAFDRSERLAVEADDESLTVRVLMSRSAAHLFRGDTDRALADLSAADGRGDEELVLRVRAQRGAILHKVGRLDEASADYRAVLAGPDVPQSLRALVTGNLGLLSIHLGDFAAARAALIDAERQNVELDEQDAVADAIHNQAYLAACVGDVPAAIDAYRRAADAREAAGAPLGVDLIDLGLLWQSLGLFEEALDLAEQVEEGLRARGMQVELGDAVLLRARALLGLNRPADAYAAAVEAVTLFRSERRSAWGAAAGYLACLARYRGGERSSELATEAERVADDLAGIGWAVAASEANLLAGQVSAGMDDEASRSRLAVVAEGRRSPVPELRVAGWHALALMRLSDADRRGALAAVRAGLSEVHRQRSGVGSPEIQATMSYRAEALAAIALELVASGRPERLLRWAENCRSGSMRLGRVRAEADDSLRQLFAERRVVIRAAEAALDEDDVPAFVRYSRARSRLDRAIRAWSRQSSGRAAQPLRAVGRDELLRALGDRDFVEFVDDRRGHLLAVVRGGRGLRRTGIGEADRIAAEIRSLRASVQHAVEAPSDGETLAMVYAHAEQLGDLLLGPLSLAGDNPLVIVPSGALFGVPWALLPGLAHRAVTIAPSATVLATQSTSRPADLGPAVFAAGPTLSHAHLEVTECSRHYRESVVLVADDASPGNVLQHMERASVAHLACHGRFRPEHPWFSSLSLGAGDLTVHELQLLGRTPWIVILAACDVGASAPAAGEEALGFVAALLASGTSSLVASPVPVSDRATSSFMACLHGELAAGTEPALALASARRNVTDAGPLTGLTANSFVAYGAVEGQAHTSMYP